MAINAPSTVRARRLRERRSRGVAMVAPVEVGEGGVAILVSNGLLKEHETRDRKAVGAACLAALEMVRGPWSEDCGTKLGPSDRAWHKLMDVLPLERWRRIVNKGNHAELIEAGKATRFGPGWPGRRCGAKTRPGGACQNPAIGSRTRCKLHGGESTEPRTPEGKARTIAAHTKHGWRSRAHVAKVKAINAEIRRITYKLKLDGLIP